ncbi:MAG TPA: GNAT family N-acetyltransferase [Rudaea sp.]|nr:GNAT family N-acetyltransferase [Rudaea sp.]
MSIAALVTPRLRLRALRPADEASFCRLYGDAETMKFIAPPLSRHAAARAFQATLDSMRERALPLFLVIQEKGRRHPVGFCGIQVPDPRMRGAEIGIVLAPVAWRKGYGREVLGALVDLAFASLPIDCVWVQYRAVNSAAARLLAGAGFSPTVVRPHRTSKTQDIRALQRNAYRKSNEEGKLPCRTSSVFLKQSDVTQLCVT